MESPETDPYKPGQLSKVQKQLNEVKNLFSMNSIILRKK